MAAAGERGLAGGERGTTKDTKVAKGAQGRRLLGCHTGFGAAEDRDLCTRRLGGAAAGGGGLKGVDAELEVPVFAPRNRDDRRWGVSAQA
jgi:hypothetical protein